MAQKAQIFQTLLAGLRFDGATLSGGTVTFYSPGTLTEKAIYIDRNKTTEAANPYTLNSNGQAELFGDGAYDVVVKNSAGVTKATWENVALINTLQLEDNSSTIYPLDIITKGPWVDLRVYADAPEGAIYAANADAAAVGKRIRVGAVVLTANLTLATDRYWDFTDASITTTGYTLNCNSADILMPDNRQVFLGSGLVTGLKWATPVMFGADTTGVVAAQNAINKAISAVALYGGKVWASPGTYLINGQINTFNNGVTLEGSGDKTIFKMQADYWDRMFYVDSKDSVTLRNFKIDGNSLNYTSNAGASAGHNKSLVSGILFQSCDDGTVDNITVVNWPTNIAIGFRGPGNRGKVTNSRVLNSGKQWDAAHPYKWHVTAIDFASNNGHVTGNTIVNTNDTYITVGEDGPNGAVVIGNIVELDNSYPTNYKDPASAGTAHGISVGGGMAVYDTSHITVSSNLIRSTHSTEKLLDGVYLGAPNATSGIVSPGNFTVNANEIYGCVNGINSEATFSLSNVFGNTIVNVTKAINFEYGAESYPHTYSNNTIKNATSLVTVGEANSDVSYTNPSYTGFNVRLRGNDAFSSTVPFPRSQFNVLKQGSFDSTTEWTGVSGQVTNPSDTSLGGTKKLLITGNGAALTVVSQPVYQKIQDGWVTFTGLVKVTGATSGDFWVDINGTGYSEKLSEYGDSAASRYQWSVVNNKGWVKIFGMLNISSLPADAAFRIVSSNLNNGATVEMKYFQLVEGIASDILHAQTSP